MIPGQLYNNFQNKFITLANLELPELPAELETAGEKFVKKPEFHITLLAVERAAQIIDESKVEELKTQIVKDFYDFVEKSPLVNWKLNGELRLVDVNGNKTVVVMAKLDGIEKLFDVLSDKYGTKLPAQPTHITLYTLPTDTFGIAINSYQELEDISKSVDISELSDKLKTVIS